MTSSSILRARARPFRFGNTLARGVKKAVDEDGALGILTGGLTASAAGITAAVIFGLLASLIFKPKDK